MIPRVLSLGGGLDSFACLVEAIRRGDKPDVVAFVDVADQDHQDPGEWPGTYRHIEEIVRPLCALEDIEFVVIDTVTYPVRDARSLFAWLWERQQIPVAGPNRICTTVAKVERFERWAQDRFRGQPIEVWVGFEAGEEKRAANDPNSGTGKATWRTNRFPLIEWGLCRCQCEALVRAAGYPVPRKSSCTFCPYGSKGDWQTFARELPEEFARIVELEARKPATTAKGRKLSIMAFRSFEKRPPPKTTRMTLLTDKLGHIYSAPTLSEFIKGAYRRVVDLCAVCGQPKATKASGCDYLPE